MAWLRVDDGMAEHRKILALPRKDRWTWLELLLYVARQNNGGHVPEAICDVLRWVTPAFIQQCVDAGLLDEDKRGYAIHDWEVYNPKDPQHADRQRRYRDRQRDGKSDGDRDASRDGVSDAPRDGESDGARDENETPPARARARGPSPTPEVSTPAAVVNPAAAADLDRLKAAGWTKRQLDDARADLDRAIAWLDAAQADPTSTKPGGLAWQKFVIGGWPEQPRTEIAPGAVGTRSTSPPLKSTTEPLPERTPPPVDLRTLGTTPPDDDPEPA